MYVCVYRAHVREKNFFSQREKKKNTKNATFLDCILKKWRNLQNFLSRRENFI
jgi:hypothetical protein